MFGWLTAAAARASRQNRSRVAVSAPASRIVLTATGRFSFYRRVARGLRVAFRLERGLVEGATAWLTAPSATLRW